MAEGLVPQPTLSDLMAQLQLLTSPQQGLGMRQQALPEPPAPDIGAALLEAGRALFGPQFLANRAAVPQTLEELLGLAGPHAGLLGKGAAGQRYGADIVEVLKRLASVKATHRYIDPAAGRTIERAVNEYRQIAPENIEYWFGQGSRKLGPQVQTFAERYPMGQGSPGLVEPSFPAVGRPFRDMNIGDPEISSVVPRYGPGRPEPIQSMTKGGQRLRQASEGPYWFDKLSPDNIQELERLMTRYDLGTETMGQALNSINMMRRIPEMQELETIVQAASQGLGAREILRLLE